MKQQHKFKDTKIGKIPEDWNIEEFNELFEVPLRNGLTRPTSVRGKGIKMVNMGEIFAYDRLQRQEMERVQVSEKEIKEYTLNEGDLLFARQSLVMSGVGKCSIFLGDVDPVTFEGHLIRVRLNKKKCDPKYYFYFFKSPKGRNVIEQYSEQVAAAGIRGSDLAKVPVPYPDKYEQQLIGGILSGLDDKIELNLELNKTLQGIGQSLFKHWFINFEYPNEKGKPYKSSGGEMIRIRNTGQEVPKGWTVGTVSDLVKHIKDVITPYDFPRKIFFHYSIPSYDEGKSPSIEEGKIIKSNKFIVKSNSILVSKLNPRMPRIWAVGEVDESNSVCSTEFQVFVPKKKWNYSYVYFSFNSGEMKDEMKSLVTGTSSSHQRVRPEDMLNLKIVIPDEGVLQKFEDISFCLRQKTWQIDTENKHLCSIRDALLPKLMSGQIRVQGSRQ